MGEGESRNELLDGRRTRKRSKGNSEGGVGTLGEEDLIGGWVGGLDRGERGGLNELLQARG